MVFNVLWTILIGVLGGIISSLIVSRVFFIQGEHQEKIKFVERVVRKLSSILTYLSFYKTVFQVDYDQEIQMEREKREKGYKTDEEYYAAHKEKRWISKDDLLKAVKKEIDGVQKIISSDIVNTPIKDEKLNALLGDIMSFTHKVCSEKEYTFSAIDKLMRQGQELQNRYDDFVHVSGRTLLKAVLKDKIMIVLYMVVAILIIGTIISGVYGL